MEGKVLMSQEELRRARVLEHVVNGRMTLYRRRGGRPEGTDRPR